MLRRPRSHKGKLKKYVPVFEERSVNNDLLVSGARNLRDYFQFQGYFDVQVDFKTVMVSNGSRENYLPHRSRRASPRAFGHRDGLPLFSKEGTSGRGLYTQCRPASSGCATGAATARVSRNAISKPPIQALYKDNGFRDTKVKVSTVDNFKGKKGDIAVTFAIERRAAIPGLRNSDQWPRSWPTRTEIMKQLASNTVSGQPFQRDQYRDGPRLHPSGLSDRYGFAGATFAFRRWRLGPGQMKMSVEYKAHRAEGGCRLCAMC